MITAFLFMILGGMLAELIRVQLMKASGGLMTPETSPRTGRHGESRCAGPTGGTRFTRSPRCHRVGCSRRCWARWTASICGPEDTTRPTG